MSLLTFDDRTALSSMKSFYPIGSIYLTTKNKNPADLFGFGTWEKIEGKFLLGAGNLYTLGSEGGEEATTLAFTELPFHKHSFSKQNKTNTASGPHASSYGGYRLVSNTETWSSSVGGGQPHNNMPPYLAVYMWKRVA